MTNINKDKNKNCTKKHKCSCMITFSCWESSTTTLNIHIIKHKPPGHHSKTISSSYVQPQSSVLWQLCVGNPSRAEDSAPAPPPPLALCWLLTEGRGPSEGLLMPGSMFHYVTVYNPALLPSAQVIRPPALLLEKSLCAACWHVKTNQDEGPVQNRDPSCPAPCPDPCWDTIRPVFNFQTWPLRRWPSRLTSLLLNGQVRKPVCMLSDTR